MITVSKVGLIHGLHGPPLHGDWLSSATGALLTLATKTKATRNTHARLIIRNINLFYTNPLLNGEGFLLLGTYFFEIRSGVQDELFVIYKLI